MSHYDEQRESNEDRLKEVNAALDEITLVSQKLFPKEYGDDVNYPRQYLIHPSGVECITITEHMNFCMGNVIKYCWRAGLKNSTTNIKDLKKALWYLKREIKRLESENDNVEK